ncbi:MAG: cupin domain-containing protein [Saprospiraceae bacterium]|nr:cupin domain-containing protein [Saprospiraceae bacterium]
MMDILKYMQSGIIEAYCLGQLSFVEMHEVELVTQRYPKIRNEITRTHATLRGSDKKMPEWRARKEHIIHILHQLRMEQDIRLEQLPLLTPYSDYHRWLAVVGHLRPTHEMESMNLCILQQTPHVMQTLIWMKTAMEEDGHEPESFRESFLVLAGECECDLGGQVIRLSAGGYVAIPPNVPHTIRNLHPGRLLLGVMQRYQAAA